MKKFNSLLKQKGSPYIYASKMALKSLLMLAFLSLSNSLTRAQELDSLQKIMEEKNGSVPLDMQQDTIAKTLSAPGDGVQIKVVEKEVIKVLDNEDSTYVKLGNKGVIQVTETRDSTRIRVGDKEISIVEREDDTDIDITDVDKGKECKPESLKFKGHWAGIALGVNNFLDHGLTLSREGESQFMDLNTDRSWGVNLNFAQYSLGFGSSHVGILTGLGLEYNNYFFDRNITLIERDDQVISDTLDGRVNKSKLTTSFLRVPLILEIQFPGVTRDKRIFLSAGIVTGIKLGSHTKVVYKGESGKNKDKNNDDFNINPFRYGITARIGYGNLNLFGDYYFSPMFVKNKGPELHPFTLGLAVSF